MVKKCEVRQKDILQGIDDHSDGDKSFAISASYILYVCSRAMELFEAQSSNLEQKRYLIDFVLSNMKLNDKKLEFNPRKPFDTITKMQKTNVWCSIVDALQTSALAATNDYKLKHLVEVFGLSGDLITV